MSMLFTPYRLGGLELPNRLVVSPMCQYRAVDGVAQPWHSTHIGTMAVSGAGLVIMEATGVEPIGRISSTCLALFDDAQERALSELVRHVRSFSSCALGIQLSHAGRKASCTPGWLPQRQVAVDEGGWETVGPSAVAFGSGWGVPRELDDRGLSRVLGAFVESARRADRCGFDLIEIHAAHGYLLSSFLSPLSNFRTDRYGGSRDNRMAFPLEVLKAVRDAWPARKPLGVRINASDLDDRGVTLDDAVALARELRRVGVDYVTLSAGNAVLGRRYPDIVPGYQVPYSERVRKESGVATMAVGMILHPEQAEEIVANGRADLVAMARAFLDDPRWGWHAANVLDAENVYPEPYTRARPERWPGYVLVHGEPRRRDPIGSEESAVGRTSSESARMASGDCTPSTRRA